ncbi:succinate dehydrogenase cytochrome b subunit [Rhabdothermincola salaria]|uniref:succinate dehydrogenase cytochrome b subunit n=1 Tax=Rhabdothermincola salaria TaxID=2903142 RepID=UPI001E3D2331|nr:succinate dehydrogenase cytochrome b subunit [Rhabdothermincola salaria]
MTATKEPSGFSPDITSTPIAPKQRRGGFALIDLYRSAIGKKWVMAITGILLMGFVFAHMVGNLKMYFGAEDFNAYGEFLRRLAYPLLPKTGALWLLRMGLIAAFALHIHAAYSLTMLNRKARPVAYQSKRDYIAVNWANRSMRWTGVIVLLFLFWHLADLTWGVDAVNGEFVYGEVYDNVVFSLERWPVALIYIVGNLALGVHLYHGSWSLFQTLGTMSAKFNPRHNPLRRGFAIGFAVIVAGANISFPIAVLTGVVG